MIQQCSGRLFINFPTFSASPIGGASTGSSGSKGKVMLFDICTSPMYARSRNREGWFMQSIT